MPFSNYLTLKVTLLLSTAVGLCSCTFKSDKLLDAAGIGDVATLSSYVMKGYDVNVRGMHGITPLMEAARKGHLPACRYLIENGANVNDHIDSGSVLMFAVASGNRALVSYLLQEGADAKWKNHLGETARAMSTKEDMLKLLPE